VFLLVNEHTQLIGDVHKRRETLVGIRRIGVGPVDIIQRCLVVDERRWDGLGETIENGYESEEGKEDFHGI